MGVTVSTASPQAVSSSAKTAKPWTAAEVEMEGVCSIA